MKTKNIKHYSNFLEKVYIDSFQSKYSNLIKVLENEDENELVKKIECSIKKINKSLNLKNKKNQINYLFNELYLKKRNYLEVCNEISSKENINLIDVINFNTDFINYFRVHCVTSLNESFENLANKYSIKLKPKTKIKTFSEQFILKELKKDFS